MTEPGQAVLVSFSGIDGAGKSTQIDKLRCALDEARLRSSLFTFWDDVATFAGFREFCSHVAFRGDKGVGSPEKPINRRDKNVASWPVMLMRFFFYLFDAAHLNFVVAKAKAGKMDVVIFDRYIYDEFANLPLQQWFVRAYVRVILKLVPKPNIAYMLDTDPAAARNRKPEYPLAFLQRNRASYLELNKIDKVLTIVASASIIEAHDTVLEALINELPDYQRASFSTANPLIES